MAFDPVSLFASGEQGVVYDCSDLTTMFQDSAGTTPAVAGSPVGKLNDRSGNNNHALQATSGKRPTLQSSATRGYYLEGDGTDDRLTVNFTIAHPFTRVSFIEARTWKSFGTVFAGGGATSNDKGALYQGPSSPTLMLYSASNGPSSGTRLDLKVQGLITEYFNGASSTCRVNQDVVTTGNPGTTDPVGLSLFDDGFGDAGNVRISRVVLINRALTSTELENVHAWLTRQFTRVVVVDGDSNSAALLIDNYAKTFIGNASPAAFVQNIAVSGTGLDINPGDLVNRTASIDARIPVAKQGRQYIYFPWWSNNAIDVSTADFARRVGEFLQARKAAGWDKVGIGTLLERTDAGQDNTAKRGPYNTYIRDATWRASYGIDFLVDFAADPVVGAVGASLNAAVCDPDGLHWLAAAHTTYLEPIFRAAVNGLPSSSFQAAWAAQSANARAMKT